MISKYQEISTEKDPIQFFMGIAHYGQYILENAATMYVLESLYKEAENDAKPYLKAWKEFYDIWKIYAQDIIKLADKVGLKDDKPTSNEIADIKNKLQNSDTSLFESGISNYFRSYWWLVRRFNDIGKSDLLMPKHFKTNESDFTISPSYHTASDEWTKFEHSRELKVWWAHYQICRLASAVLDLNEREDYFKDDNVIDRFYKYEFDELARGNLSRNPIVLHENKYRIWIKRLHEYLIPRLQNVNMELVIGMFRKHMYLEETADKQANSIKWSDNFKWEDDTTFIINDKQKVSFGAKSSDRITIFKMLTAAKGDWVKVKDMSKETGKTEHLARVAIGQINEKYLKGTTLEIIERNDKNSPGAYKISIIGQTL